MLATSNNTMKIYIPTFLHKYRFYVITASGLLVWITFFDGSNLISQFRLWQKYTEIENQKEYYVEALKKVKHEEKEVMGNTDAMEKFAREKYLMKKTGETVFVIVDKENKTIEKKRMRILIVVLALTTSAVVRQIFYVDIYLEIHDKNMIFSWSSVILKFLLHLVDFRRRFSSHVRTIRLNAKTAERVTTKPVFANAPPDFKARAAS